MKIEMYDYVCDDVNNNDAMCIHDADMYATCINDVCTIHINEENAIHLQTSEYINLVHALCDVMHQMQQSIHEPIDKQMLKEKMKYVASMMH